MKTSYFLGNIKILSYNIPKYVSCPTLYKTLSNSSFQYRSMSYNKDKDLWNKKFKEKKDYKYKTPQVSTKKFQRCIEDFECENCGTEVIGNGYTNHCPECLFSKHVDINPGDRAEECRGMMEPIGFSTKKGKPVIIHKCKDCGIIRNNKAGPDDNLTLEKNILSSNLKDESKKLVKSIKEDKYKYYLKECDHNVEDVPLIKSSDFYGDDLD